MSYDSRQHSAWLHLPERLVGSCTAVPFEHESLSCLQVAHSREINTLTRYNKFLPRIAHSILNGMNGALMGIVAATHRVVNGEC